MTPHPPAGRAPLFVALLLFAVGWGANAFTPLLLVYRERAGMSSAALGAVFGIYALSLAPGFFFGAQAAARFGRRALVLPFGALALLSSGVLALGSVHVAFLFAGRALMGASAGVTFSVGSTWLRELSAGTAPDLVARRTAIALSSGFALGPLVAGAMAEWLPHPMVLPYLAHALVFLCTAPFALFAPETVAPAAGPAHLPRARLSQETRRRFVRVLLPRAPWVFGFVGISMVILPGLLPPGAVGHRIAFGGLVAALTLLSGVVATQRSLTLSSGRSAALGLRTGALGTLVGVLAVQLGAPLLLGPAAVLLGTGYGLGLTGGLRQVAVLAAPEEQARVTGLFYACIYTGFSFPLLLALLSGAHPLAGLLVLAAVALGTSFVREGP